MIPYPPWLWWKFGGDDENVLFQCFLFYAFIASAAKQSLFDAAPFNEIESSFVLAMTSVIGFLLINTNSPFLSFKWIARSDFSWWIYFRKEIKNLSDEQKSYFIFYSLLITIETSFLLLNTLHLTLTISQSAPLPSTFYLPSSNYWRPGPTPQGKKTYWSKLPIASSSYCF